MAMGSVMGRSKGLIFQMVLGDRVEILELCISSVKKEAILHGIAYKKDLADPFEDKLLEKGDKTSSTSGVLVGEQDTSVSKRRIAMDKSRNREVEESRSDKGLCEESGESVRGSVARDMEKDNKGQFRRIWVCESGRKRMLGTDEEGQKSAINKESTKGYRLVKRKYRQMEQKASLETSTYKDSLCGCVNDRLVDTEQGKSSRLSDESEEHRKLGIGQLSVSRPRGKMVPTNGLEVENELCMSFLRSGALSFDTYSRVQGKGGINFASKGISSIVANVSWGPKSGNEITTDGVNYCPGSVRPERTVQQFSLKTNCGEHRLVDVCLTRAEDLASQVVNRRLVEDSRFGAASSKVPRSCNKKADWPWDPFLIKALRKYHDNPPEKVDLVIWYRDLALVALGFRMKGKLRVKNVEKCLGLVWKKLNNKEQKEFEIALESEATWHLDKEFLAVYHMQCKRKTSNENAIYNKCKELRSNKWLNEALKAATSSTVKFTPHHYYNEPLLKLLKNPNLRQIWASMNNNSNEEFWIKLAQFGLSGAFNGNSTFSELVALILQIKEKKFQDKSLKGL
ncbi:hypothetical protein C2G38_2151099 [Gigaspora rosea]|uniref:Uncharacterized protein n=1 Tax=Gigaspora rosea TaxID=44941 RepID=A0A397WAU2_9GLOM|nr:hypothetical protein C2G38_2151099 [Gigaspora rosea]